MFQPYLDEDTPTEPLGLRSLEVVSTDIEIISQSDVEPYNLKSFKTIRVQGECFTKPSKSHLPGDVICIKIVDNPSSSRFVLVVNDGITNYDTHIPFLSSMSVAYEAALSLTDKLLTANLSNPEMVMKLKDVASEFYVGNPLIDKDHKAHAGAAFGLFVVGTTIDIKGVEVWKLEVCYIGSEPNILPVVAIEPGQKPRALRPSGVNHNYFGKYYGDWSNIIIDEFIVANGTKIIAVSDGINKRTLLNNLTSPDLVEKVGKASNDRDDVSIAKMVLV